MWFSGLPWIFWEKPRYNFAISQYVRSQNFLIAYQMTCCSIQLGYVKAITRHYSWKQPLMMEIWNLVQWDTPWSKVLNTYPWQHMSLSLSVCLFVCFPNDTPLRLRTELLVPFNTTPLTFERLAALFDLLTAADILCLVIMHSKPVNVVIQQTNFHFEL